MEASQLQVRRLNKPVGCPTVHLGTYNAAPGGALGGIRCRILDVRAAGKYTVSPVDAQNLQLYGEVYDASGQKVCGTGYCDIPAAGKYTMVLDGSVPSSVIDNDLVYVFALLPAQPTGCASVSDSADPGVPHQGDPAVGQYDCLRLPTPANASIVGLRPVRMPWRSLASTAHQPVRYFHRPRIGLRLPLDPVTSRRASRCRQTSMQPGRRSRTRLPPARAKRAWRCSTAPASGTAARTRRKTLRR